jgi:hypothetical protein
MAAIVVGKNRGIPGAEDASGLIIKESRRRLGGGEH